MTVRTAWLLPEGQTREDTRLTPLGTMAPEGPLTTRGGVIAAPDALTATGVAAMQVQISTGRAVVQGTAAQGAYPVAVTSPETLTVADGNAQYDRIDTVILRVDDELYDTSEQTLATLDIVQGTPSDTPTAPDLPTAAVRLWDITVPAGASAGVGGLDWSSALADRRAYTTSYGGVIPRGYGTSYPGAYDGQYRDTGTGLERWSAADSDWLPYPYDSGWQSLALSAGYGNPGHGTAAGWRRIGPMVLLRGRIGRTNGKPITSGDTIATIPSALRPAGGAAFAWAAPRDLVGSAPSVTRAEITSSGTLRIYEGSNSSAPEWISLDAVTYCTD
ncbi:hypothetical protein DEH18_33460 [Streptomyces sp. NHF165]|uniref:hypothetical protein n=1 Tax=Streptomyces sp. NHF165 TaxID=2175864 RepID=UPI00132EFA0B|nr:hypothetical protein [Streptomyces sp. NHF165]QHF97936.1 hypothetical protein DEH18_33460 [Streptomyces sp. NHF165]